LKIKVLNPFKIEPRVETKQNVKEV
jgi:hypothetical protein